MSKGERRERPESQLWELTRRNGTTYIPSEAAFAQPVFAGVDGASRANCI